MLGALRLEAVVRLGGRFGPGIAAVGWRPAIRSLEAFAGTGHGRAALASLPSGLLS
jgi:hypothetical protein